MSDAMQRGDRHIAADPQGTAMNLFRKDGDIILNPFHLDCAHWDLLAEIEAPSEYAFLAASLLPHLGRGDQDEWITYTQQLLAGALENFVALELGGSDAFAAMMGNGKIDELKALCVETPASRYFEPGGERILASILETLAPARAFADDRFREGSVLLGSAVDTRRPRLALDSPCCQPDRGAGGALPPAE